MKKIICLIALSVTLWLTTGCEKKADFDVEEYIDKIITCMDHQDRSTFSFNTTTLYLDGEDLHLTTLAGEKMVLTTDDHDWVTCEMEGVEI